MADVKDKNLLKKEKKEREKLQKEREKQERARRKQEEKERKREKAEKNKHIAGVISEDSGPPIKQTNGISISSEPLSKPSRSRPEAVSVVEPPSQITAFGLPIRIAFNTENAGEGALSASCKGTRIGDVLTEVTEQGKGLCYVQFTPNESDMYTLHVHWGGTDVTGSPFQINLSRLSHAPKDVGALESKVEAVNLPEGVEQNEPKGQEKEGEKELEIQDTETQETEGADSFIVSDDPFNLAYSASRVLEQQRIAQSKMSYPEPIQTKASYSEPVETKVSYPESGLAKMSYPDTAVATQSSSSAQQSFSQQLQAPAGITAAPPPHSSHAPGMLSYPTVVPPPHGSHAPGMVTEELLHLKESNESLKKTNEGLGEEIAELRQKMTNFESKLGTLEEATQQSEEERKVLIANTNVKGWLYKRGIKGPLANVWRRRYFRCDQGSKIYYYKSAEEGIPQGYIDLDKVLSVEKDATEKDQERPTFSIFCEGRTFQMQTDDETTMEQWISAITYLKNWRQKCKTLPGTQPQ